MIFSVCYFFLCFFLSSLIPSVEYDKIEDTFLFFPPSGFGAVHYIIAFLFFQWLLFFWFLFWLQKTMSHIVYSDVTINISKSLVVSCKQERTQRFCSAWDLSATLLLQMWYRTSRMVITWLPQVRNAGWPNPKPTEWKDTFNKIFG